MYSTLICMHQSWLSTNNVSCRYAAIFRYLFHWWNVTHQLSQSIYTWVGGQTEKYSGLTVHSQMFDSAAQNYHHDWTKAKCEYYNSCIPEAACDQGTLFCLAGDLLHPQPNQSSPPLAPLVTSLRTIYQLSCPEGYKDPIPLPTHRTPIKSCSLSQLWPQPFLLLPHSLKNMS